MSSATGSSITDRCSHRSGRWTSRTRPGEVTGHGMAAGGRSLHIAQGVEQPLALAVQKSRDVTVIVGGKCGYFDMAGSDDDAPLRCCAASTKVVGDLGAANLKRGHHATVP